MTIKICIELELDAAYHEYDDGRVEIFSLNFPNCTQNLLPFLSGSEQRAAQQAVEDEVEKALQEKYDRLRERKAMRGDIAREIQQEEIASRNAQRGNRA